MNINGEFMDASARKVALKGLWSLKCHRHDDTSAPPPAWPAWMAQSEDY
ncbi:MAG: hypothetical protein ACYTEL_12620 [Planctomycetota bacterium]